MEIYFNETFFPGCRSVGRRTTGKARESREIGENSKRDYRKAD